MKNKHLNTIEQVPALNILDIKPFAFSFKIHGMVKDKDLKSQISGKERGNVTKERNYCNVN